MQSYEVTDPKRLDAFLAEQAAGFSRARIQTAIENGCVTVNGQIIEKSSQKLKAGDVVVFDPEEEVEEESNIEPYDLKLEILYEDDDCFVVYKPAGISVHPGTGMAPDEKTLLHGGRFIAPQAELVHRLDKETTGCLLLAKNPNAHSALQKQFEDRSVSKTYLAIVAGVPNPPKAMIDAPIGRNTIDRTKMSVVQSAGSREARTTYTTLDAASDAALIQCDLHTGRTHQIRVHMLSVGYPLLGDDTYHTVQSEELSEKYQIQNLCLHAWKLSFVSPTSGKQVDVVAELPESFTAALDVAKLQR